MEPVVYPKDIPGKLPDTEMLPVELESVVYPKDIPGKLPGTEMLPAEFDPVAYLKDNRHNLLLPTLVLAGNSSVVSWGFYSKDKKYVLTFDIQGRNTYLVKHSIALFCHNGNTEVYFLCRKKDIKQHFAGVWT